MHEFYYLVKGKYKIIEIEKPIPQPNEMLIQHKTLSLCNQHDWKVNKCLYRDL